MFTFHTRMSICKGCFRLVLIQFVVQQHNIKNKTTMAVQMRRRRLIVRLVMDLNKEIVELVLAILPRRRIGSEGNFGSGIGC